MEPKPPSAPPKPPSPVTPRPRNPAAGPAQISWILPLVSCGISGAMRANSNEPKSREEMLGSAIAILVICLILYITGLVCGIRALILAPKHGTVGIVVQACIGVTLNVIMLAVLVAGLVFVLGSSPRP